MDELVSFQRGETLRRRLKTPPTGGLMWCEPNGKHLSRHAEVSNFARLLKEAELPRRTPHDIRHMTATLMIAEGASILQVQHQLRPSTPSITLNHYGRLLPSDRRSGFGDLWQTNAGLTPPTKRGTGTDGQRLGLSL